MTLPSDSFGLAVLVLLVIPGSVYAAVRTRVAGRVAHDGETTARVLRAVLASFIFGSVYLLLLGEWVVDLVSVEEAMQRPRALALTALGLGITLPAIVAYLMHGRIPLIRKIATKAPTVPQALRPATGHTAIMTGWDWATDRTGDTFVRVRLSDGVWVGGWFGADSFVSTYPEPRDIYVECAFKMSSDGSFLEPKLKSQGFWMSLPPDAIVEWVAPDDDNDEETNGEGPHG